MLAKNEAGIQQTVGEIRQFSKDLNDPNGLLGALLHDKEMAKNLHEFTANLLQLSKELNDPNGSSTQLTDSMLRLSKGLNDPNGKLNRLRTACCTGN